jgi:hypothetical protein
VVFSGDRHDITEILVKVALNTLTLISVMEGAFDPILIKKKYIYNVYEIHKNELFLTKVIQLKIIFQLRWEILERTVGLGVISVLLLPELGKYTIIEGICSIFEQVIPYNLVWDVLGLINGEVVYKSVYKYNLFKN